MNLKDKTIFGVFWNGLGKLVNQFVQFLIMAVLAKLLVPADFGIIGIALIFTRLITILNEFGIAAAIVQKKEIDDYDIAALFTASLLSGIILLLILYFGAPYLAAFFDTAVLDKVLKTISITLLIGAMGIIPKALLNRGMKFKIIANIEIAGVIVYGVVSISMAILDYKVWSIVFGIIANNVVCTILFWIVNTWKPQLYFNYERIKSLVRFGLNVFGTNVVNYTGANLSSFITGKFLGTSMLGIFTLANATIHQTIGRLSFIVGRVMFPALSTIQDDNDRYINVFLKVLQVITLFSFPFLIWLILLAKPFVMAVFGDKWSGSIFPLQAFAVVSLVTTVGNNVGTVLLSKGRSDIEFKWNIIYYIISLIIMLVTVRYGLNMLVLGMVIQSFVGTFIIQKITYSLINLTVTKVMLNVLPNFLSALAMGITISIYDHFCSAYMPVFVFLISAAILALVSYIGFLFVFNNRQMHELKISLKDMMFFEKIKNVRRAVV